jgi:two-component system, NarL family, response regulator
MMTGKRIRILVADDHLVARVGLTTILNLQPDMTVVAQATDGEQAIAMYKEFRPDVAILDLRMPNMSGVAAATAILEFDPHARNVVLTSYGGDEDVRRALAAGVKAYLTKDLLHDEMLSAIRKVAQGGTHYPPGFATSQSFAQPVLSAREIQVLELIVQGLANKQIAYALNIAEYTVKNHVKHILSKLGVHDRTQAVTAAIQRGIVHLS